MIQAVNAFTPKVLFKGHENINPVNRKMERRIAVINSAGISGVIGAVTAIITRNYTSSWKNASLLGLGAGIIAMLVVCPKLLYRAGVRAYTKEKELEVFTKEKEVQKKLLADVDEAINTHGDNLQDKIENYAKATCHKGC